MEIVNVWWTANVNSKVTLTLYTYSYQMDTKVLNRAENLAQIPPELENLCPNPARTRAQARTKSARIPTESARQISPTENSRNEFFFGSIDKNARGKYNKMP